MSEGRDRRRSNRSAQQSAARWKRAVERGLFLKLFFFRFGAPWRRTSKHLHCFAIRASFAQPSAALPSPRSHFPLSDAVVPPGCVAPLLGHCPTRPPACDSSKRATQPPPPRAPISLQTATSKTLCFPLALCLLPLGRPTRSRAPALAALTPASAQAALPPPACHDAARLCGVAGVVVGFDAAGADGATATAAVEHGDCQQHRHGLAILCPRARRACARDDQLGADWRRSGAGPSAVQRRRPLPCD